MSFMRLEGAEGIRQRWSGISRRAASPTTGVARVMIRLEEAERKLFEDYHGEYVDTGRLERSLAGSSSDSIREIHEGRLVFGTRVPYAKYLRRQGGSAVLAEWVPGLRLEASRMIMDEVMHG